MAMEANAADEFTPRNYQLELMEIALKKNTIIYLPTGSGKTFIAVLVLKQMGHSLAKSYSEGGKLSFVLVNTVTLIDQHAKVIEKRTCFKVGRYSGEMNLDGWPKSKWLQEFNKHQVIVMTVQILANLTISGFIDLNKVNLLVFDECHRGVNDQPMRQLCKLFEHLHDKPRVLGMTATLLNGNCKPSKVIENVRALEVTYHGQVATVDGLAKVVGYSTNPTENILEVSRHVPTAAEINVKHHLSYVIDVIRSFKVPVAVVEPPSTGLMPLNKNRGLKQLENLIQDIILQIDWLGAYGGCEALLAHAIQVERISKHCEEIETCRMLKYVQTMLSYCREILQRAMSGHSEYEKIVLFSSDKMRKLIGLFEHYPKTSQDLSALIFTKRRFTAKVIYYVLNSLSKASPDLAYIKANFLVGNNSNPYSNTREGMYLSKRGREILQQFDNNDLNVLVASNVLEEGVDIGTCSLVVKFEMPEEYRSYIQSKGRARNKSSRYVMLVDADAMDKFMARYREYQQIEGILNDLLIGENLNRSEPSDADLSDLYQEDCLRPYFVDSSPNSARVTSTSAISLLATYCQSLPSDKYTDHAPELFYQKKLNGDGRQLCSVVIRMPIICPIDVVTGPFMPGLKLAKRAAALKTCEMLHKCGELDDSLAPRKRRVPEEDVGFLFAHYPAVKEPDAGTNKRKRLHRHVIPPCVTGALPLADRVYLHIIELRPMFARSENVNTAAIFDMYDSDLCYGVITPKPAPTVCDFPVYVSQGTLSVSLRVNASCVRLDAGDIDDVKAFNVLVYADMLRCLKEFLVVDNSDGGESMWIVPVDRKRGAVDFGVLKRYKKIEEVAEPSHEEKSNLEVDLDGYLRKIVAPWYRDTGFYLVTEVTFGKTAWSEFPNESFATYEDYFREKHNLQLAKPELPLLYVKALSQRRNCYKPRGDSKKGRDDKFDELEIHLVPELVVRQDFPAPLWLQAALLPTVLSRLSFLFRLELLRSTIAREAGLGRDVVFVKTPLELDRHLLNYEPRVAGTKETTARASSVNGFEVTQLPALNVHKDYAHRVLERDYPWKDIEEPKDVERDIDDVTVMDVEYYEKFIGTTLREGDVHLKNDRAAKGGNRLALTYHKDYAFRPIGLLEREAVAEGPELAVIYKAATTAKANDVVNMERLETLGDSFLKMFATIYIYLRFSSYNEGLSTTLKGRLISNKNLYYLGKLKHIAATLKNADLQLSNWLPPGFKIPELVTSRIGNGEAALASLYHVWIPVDEQTSGTLSAETVAAIIEDRTEPDPSEDGLINEIAPFFRSNHVGDKQVADCVEALLGAYFECCGIAGGLKFLEWVGVVPPSERLADLLDAEPADPILRPEKTTVAEVVRHVPLCAEIEATLGYRFRNRGYLLQALTHASYSTNRITQSYEKLEFVGDAVLDFLITCHIYESCGNLSPGELTDLRSALVNNNTFATLTVKYNLHKHLLLTSSKLQGLVDTFAGYVEAKGFEVDDEVLSWLTEGVDDDDRLNIAEYIDVPKVLGDLFESVAGAIYLDSGKDLRQVWSVFHRLMWKELEAFSANVPKNLVRRLYEWAPNPHPIFGKPVDVQKGKVMVPLEFMTNGHMQRVHGFGSNKALAKKAAAKLALRFLS
ncbi:endoribonuclease Dicer [Cylas formicarius]|uniref:endoribonuclease Dicer n=1 Tax=Cylas formicarius TaxID=197179 RepID=UPI0029585CA8|nr:endoribonuclease Dicer [Cylas formicarius]